MKKKFSCVQGCSDCCIYREYYPSFEYGKIGVLVCLRRKLIERLAKNMGVRVRIIPRLAVGKNSPDRIIAYQMMGKNEDGDPARSLMLKVTKGLLMVDLNAKYTPTGRLHVGHTL